MSRRHRIRTHADAARQQADQHKRRPRWQLLRSYLHALLYPERDPHEHAEVQERVDEAVRTEHYRREVNVMGRTSADVFREQGELRGQVKTLLRQLRLRFGTLPAETVALVEARKNEDQFDAWLDVFVNARPLAQVGVRLPE